MAIATSGLQGLSVNPHPALAMEEWADRNQV
jgi:hypothetical protein